MAKTLGEKIKAARKKLNMTQDELAGDDFTKGFISQVELNHINPSLKSLRKIALRLHKPLHYFLEGIDEDDFRRCDLVLALGAAHLKMGNLKDSETALDEALTLAETQQNEQKQISALLLLSQNKIKKGEYQKAVSSLLKAASLREDGSVNEDSIKIDLLLGYVYCRMGELDKAEGSFNSSLRLLENTGRGYDYLKAFALAGLAEIELEAGQFDKAKRILNKALDQIGRHRSIAAVAEYFLDEGISHARDGNRNKALVYLSRGTALIEAMEIINLTGFLEQRMGKAYAALDEGNKAVAYFKSSRNQFHQAGNRIDEADALLQIARYHYSEGDYEEAENSCREAIALLENLEAPLERGRLYRMIGVLTSKKGDYDTAGKYLRDSAAIFSKLDERLELADTYSELGNLHTSIGQQTEANEYFRKSIALYQDRD